MMPERLEYLHRFDKFYNVLVEQAKTNSITEQEFMMLIAVKAKCMGKEAHYQAKALQN